MAHEEREAALQQLMVQYQDAVPEAAAALVDLLSPRLYAFFSTQMGSRAEADDMLQDVWLRIHRVRHTYRPDEPVLPWVYAIAHRVRVDNYRRRRSIARELAMDPLPEFAACRPDGAPPAFDVLIADLPESQREVLTLLKVEGLSVEEVARVMSTTAGAVKQKAHRAYERLRGMLKSASPRQVEPRGGVR